MTPSLSPSSLPSPPSAPRAQRFRDAIEFSTRTENAIKAANQRYRDGIVRFVVADWERKIGTQINQHPDVEAAPSDERGASHNDNVKSSSVVTTTIKTSESTRDVSNKRTRAYHPGDSVGGNDDGFVKSSKAAKEKEKAF
ncbi:hypothetical protein SBOR_5682 [Sclerotinia borealis F-4128]|uniref:Uncharacterized protein n=1 Tax=Sclerotinia borealis (strain F-4128) TaxID=1432307 RepID=W9CDK3_SCLBF|nr:hypothetical protein SBOR_5682 [Sclerotinia borealis F-4128]